jgi:hypothetical protein
LERDGHLVIYFFTGVHILRVGVEGRGCPPPVTDYDSEIAAVSWSLSPELRVRATEVGMTCMSVALPDLVEDVDLGKPIVLSTYQGQLVLHVGQVAGVLRVAHRLFGLGGGF